MMATPASATTEPADNYSHAVSNQQLPQLENVLLSADNSANVSESEATKNDDKTPTRAAVKKPTFKAVSVNKTFLAAKNASNSTLKNNEKSVTSSAASTPPTSSTLPASRPRLIAKTGGSSAVPKFAAVNNGSGSNPPEPSGVWNKNRPAAPATPPVDPKKVTDEDLKKHGIHVAERLHTDDSRPGQANWADIEDDDDWVPDAITWNDGTKTEIPHADSTHADSTHADSTHADSTHASPLVQSLDPSKSVITPTIPASTPKSGSLGTGRPGLILRASNNEKPTLVSKSPAPPVQTKNPWAPLPSIDKVSPAVSSMPTPHQSQQQAQQHHNNGHQNGGYRDNYHSHGQRNLDPALDRRMDYGRPGFGLGRPRQGSFHDYNGSTGYPPRQQYHDGPWDRNRRGSMNMGNGPGRYQQTNGPPPHVGYPNDYSAGPGSYGYRRPSFNDGPRRPSFSHGPRRPSFADGPDGRPSLHPDSGPGSVAVPNSPSINGSEISQTASRVHGPSWQNRISASPLLSQATVSHTHSMIPEEETGEFQKRLMREKAEEAMRRRQEQEAKEEAAKQERLRRKLEALGPPPERISEKKATPVVATVQAINPDSPRTQTVSVSEALVARTQELPVTTTSESQAEASPSHAARSGWEVPLGAPNLQAGPSSQRNLGWGSGPRNVWGAPNNDRGLGNGAFMNGVPPPVSHPTPIGPPSRKVSGADGPHEVHSTEMQNEGHGMDMPPVVLKATWRQTQPDIPHTTSIEPHPAIQPIQIQTRSSRFFPIRDSRIDQSSYLHSNRPHTPSPPPPMSTDHPVYNGNPAHPNVSLPRPLPVVRLPPSQSTGNIGLGHGHKNHLSVGSDTTGSDSWKDKISTLLSDHKPKSPTMRRASVDENRPLRPVSRGTTWARIVAPRHVVVTFSSISKPMASDCFEEPEMGSLPQIRLPKVVPNAAWRPAPHNNKPLPRRFMIFNNTSSREPDFYDQSGQIRIRILSTSEAKYMSHHSAQTPSVSAFEGRSRRSRSNKNHSQRAESEASTPVVSQILQNKAHQESKLNGTSKAAANQSESKGTSIKELCERKEVKKRRSSAASREQEFQGLSIPNETPASGSVSRRGRGSYRGRGSDWGRRGGATSGH